MTKSIAGRLALGALACLLLAQGAAFGADPLRLTEPVRATEADLDPLRTWGAPFLAVNPDDSTLIAAGMHEFRSKKCSLAISRDAGQTWTFKDGDPALPSYPFCLANNSNIFQAPIAWGSNDTIYMAMSAWDTQDTRSKVSVQVARTTDLGDTWSTTLVHDARSIDHNNRPVTSVAVDTSGAQDVVYVTWRAARDQDLPSDERQHAASAATVAVSTDGGETFGSPVFLADQVFEDEAVRNAAFQAAGVDDDGEAPDPADNIAGNFGGGNSVAVLDDSGNVYVAWKSSSSRISPSPPAGVFVSKSTDQGQTWTHSQVRPFDPANGSTFVIPMITWVDAGGSEGTLHMAYEGSDQPDVRSYSNIFYTRSTDGGATWAEPTMLRDVDPSEVVGGYLPHIDSAPNGRVDVTWWDVRNDPGIRANDVYYVYSNDNGSTWSENIRVTDQTIDRRFGVWGNNFDQNSPPNVESTNAYALFGWDDTRLSRGEDGAVLGADPIADQAIGAGVQDVFISAVQFSEIGGGTSNAAKAVLAGVVGLVAVGLILLVVVFAGKGGAGGARSRGPKTTAKTEGANVS